MFFDTYSNMQQGHQQYISVMVNDGTQAYDHSKDGGDAKLAGCPLDFRGKDSSVFARILYQENLLRLYLDAGQGEWQECFIVRNVHLPRGHYFGVSAATGDLADNHDILSIKVGRAKGMRDYIIIPNKESGNIETAIGTSAVVSLRHCFS